MRLTAFALATLAVAGLAVAVWAFGFDGLKKSEQEAAETPSTAKSAGPPPQEVGAWGRVLPADRIVNVAGPTGERLVELKVGPGDDVEKGQPLAVFESYAVRQAEVDAAEAAIADAKRQESLIRASSEAKLAEADGEQKRLLAGLDLKIQGEKSQVEALTRAATESKQVLDKLTRLSGTRAVSPRDVESQQLAVDKSRTELEAVELSLKQSEMERDQAPERFRLQREAAEKETERLLAALAIPSLEAHRDAAKTARDRGLVTAPSAGTVLDVAAQPGETPTGAFLRLADTRRMVVVAEVWESDIGRVRPGAKATVTADALDKPLTGKVTRVGRAIRPQSVYSLDPAARSDNRVVEVEIALDDPEAASRLIDLQVEVKIDAAPAKSGGGEAGTGVKGPDEPGADRAAA